MITLVSSLRAIYLNSKENPYHTVTSLSDNGHSFFFKVTGASLGASFKLGMIVSICCCYECLLIPIQKINIIAQFNLDILLIQYWEILLAYPGVPDDIHMNALNQIDSFYLSSYM